MSFEKIFQNNYQRLTNKFRNGSYEINPESRKANHIIITVAEDSFSKIINILSHIENSISSLDLNNLKNYPIKIIYGSNHAAIEEEYNQNETHIKSAAYFINIIDWYLSADKESENSFGGNVIEIIEAQQSWAKQPDKSQTVIYSSAPDTPNKSLDAYTLKPYQMANDISSEQKPQFEDILKQGKISILYKSSDAPTIKIFIDRYLSYVNSIL